MKEKEQNKQTNPKKTKTQNPKNLENCLVNNDLVKPCVDSLVANSEAANDAIFILVKTFICSFPDRFGFGINLQYSKS